MQERKLKAMSKIMSVAAGLAIGYFIYQYFVSNNRGTTHGRLHKSAHDKKISGVCAGLAEYFGMDATVLRIIFLITLIYGGLGFWAYVIIWALAPAKPLDPPVEQQ